MFFSDYCEDKILPSQRARISAKEEILHSMDCVLHKPRNFIGVIDDQGRTLQFMVNEDKTIQVDVPVPARRGSYVKTTNLAGCLAIIRDLGDAIAIEEIDGLTFQAW